MPGPVTTAHMAMDSPIIQSDPNALSVPGMTYAQITAMAQIASERRRDRWAGGWLYIRPVYAGGAERASPL